jgi:O-antigen ligase
MLQEIIKNNLLFGLGYGFYNMDNEIGNTGGIFVEFQNGHNETLSLLTTTGLIGLFFVIIIYIKAISNVFDYIKKTNFSKPSLFFLSCLIFSMILNTTDKTSNSFNIEWFMIILFQFPEFFEKLSAETNFL